MLREDRARTMLHLAAASGHADCASLLVDEFDALVHWRDLDHNTAAALAVSAGHTECVRVLLERCVFVDSGSLASCFLEHGRCYHAMQTCSRSHSLSLCVS